MNSSGWQSGVFVSGVCVVSSARCSTGWRVTLVTTALLVENITDREGLVTHTLLVSTSLLDIR